MKAKRISRQVVVAAVLVGALALSGCGPSQEQIDCESNGGEWVSELDYFMPVSTGKTVVLVPVYEYHCEVA